MKAPVTFPTKSAYPGNPTPIHKQPEQLQEQENFVTASLSAHQISNNQSKQEQKTFVTSSPSNYQVPTPNPWDNATKRQVRDELGVHHFPPNFDYDIIENLFTRIKDKLVLFKSNLSPSTRLVNKIPGYEPLGLYSATVKGINLHITSVTISKYIKKTLRFLADIQKDQLEKKEKLIDMNWLLRHYEILERTCEFSEEILRISKLLALCYAKYDPSGLSGFKPYNSDLNIMINAYLTEKPRNNAEGIFSYLKDNAESRYSRLKNKPSRNANGRLNNYSSTQNNSDTIIDIPPMNIEYLLNRVKNSNNYTPKEFATARTELSTILTTIINKQMSELADKAKFLKQAPFSSITGLSSGQMEIQKLTEFPMNIIKILESANKKLGEIDDSFAPKLAELEHRISVFIVVCCIGYAIVFNGLILGLDIAKQDTHTIGLNIAKIINFLLAVVGASTIGFAWSRGVEGWRDVRQAINNNLQGIINEQKMLQTHIDQLHLPMQSFSSSCQTSLEGQHVEIILN